MATTVVMPQLGESVVEGTVVRWIAKPGQKINRDEPLVEVSTDKANTEVPSPTSGVLVEQLAPEGAVVQVGAPLARLDESAAGASPAPAQLQQQPKATPAPQAAQPSGGDGQQGGNGFRASPVARNVAEQHGVDLSKIPPTAQIDILDVDARVGCDVVASHGD